MKGCKTKGISYNGFHVAVQQFSTKQLFNLNYLLEIIMLTAEQIMASHKANIETLFGLTQKAFEGVEKLVELNVQATKAALAETANNAQAVMGAKDAQELLALQASMVQPLAEKTAAYSRHLYEIAQSSSAEISKSFEGQTAEAQKKVAEMIETATQNAPAGSETAVTMMKSAMTAANSAFESVQKAVKQAGDMAETNFKSVSESAVNASKNVTKKR